MNTQDGVQPAKTLTRRFDIAYGGYCVLGASALWLARVIFPGSPAAGTSQYDAFLAGLAFMIVIPLALPTVAALLVTCWLTFQLSRDIWLVALLLITWAFAAYLFVSMNLQRFHWFPVLLYGAVCVSVGLWLFLYKRWRPLQLSPEEAASSSADTNQTV